MSYMITTRLVVLCTTLTFAVILVAVDADLYYIENKWLYNPDTFPLLVIATSGIAILSIPTMLIVGAIRNGAVTSMILFEIVWLQILSILFLAGGSLASQKFKEDLNIDCGEIAKIYRFEPDDLVRDLTTGCREYGATQAFAFLTWIILFLYTLVLSVLSVIAQSRGKPVWLVSVKDAVFFPPPPDAVLPAGATIIQSPVSVLPPGAQIVQYVQVPVQGQPTGGSVGIPSQTTGTSVFVPPGQQVMYQQGVPHSPGTPQV